MLFQCCLNDRWSSLPSSRMYLAENYLLFPRQVLFIYLWFLCAGPLDLVENNVCIIDSLWMLFISITVSSWSSGENMMKLNWDTLGDSTWISMKVIFFSFFRKVAVTRHTMKIKTQYSSHNIAEAHLNEAQNLPHYTPAVGSVRTLSFFR